MAFACMRFGPASMSSLKIPRRDSCPSAARSSAALMVSMYPIISNKLGSSRRLLGLLMGPVQTVSLTNRMPAPGRPPTDAILHPLAASRRVAVGQSRNRHRRSNGRLRADRPRSTSALEKMNPPSGPGRLPPDTVRQPLADRCSVPAGQTRQTEHDQRGRWLPAEHRRTVSPLGSRRRR